MKPKTPHIPPPVGPVQSRIIRALEANPEGMSAQQLTDWLNLDRYPGEPATTLASVRDTLYRRMVARGHVVKGPVSFRLPGGKGA